MAETQTGADTTPVTPNGKPAAPDAAAVAAATTITPEAPVAAVPTAAKPAAPAAPKEIDPAVAAELKKEISTKIPFTDRDIVPKDIQEAVLTIAQGAPEDASKILNGVKQLKAGAASKEDVLKTLSEAAVDASVNLGADKDGKIVDALVVLTGKTSEADKKLLTDTLHNDAKAKIGGAQVDTSVAQTDKDKDGKSEETANNQSIGDLLSKPGGTMVMLLMLIVSLLGGGKEAGGMMASLFGGGKDEKGKDAEPTSGAPGKQAGEEHPAVAGGAPAKGAAPKEEPLRDYSFDTDKLAAAGYKIPGTAAAAGGSPTVPLDTPPVPPGAGKSVPAV